MDRGSSFTLLSVSLILTASFVIAVLIGENPLWTLIIMLAVLSAGFLISSIHHRISHKPFLLDSLLIASALAIGSLAAIVVLLLAGALAAQQSSLDPYTLAAAVSFFTGGVGIFVFQFVYAYRFEAKRWMTVRAILGGLVLGAVGALIVHLSMVVYIDTQFDTASAFEYVPLEENERISDAYAALSGTRVIGAVHELERTRIERYDASYDALTQCHTLMVDTVGCARRVTDTIEATVELVITHLLLEGFIIDASNTEPTPGSLAPGDLELLRVVAIIPDRHIGELSIEQSGIIPFTDTPPGSAVEGAIGSLVRSTLYAEDIDDMTYAVYTFVSHVSAHNSLMVPAWLLEREPGLADDPLFIAVTNERLAEHHLQE